MKDETIIAPKKVEDTYGNIIYLEGDYLGEGGQGVVFRTKEKDLAIKFLMKNGTIIEDESIYEKYKSRIEDISILKLEDDINVCRPEMMLKKPICGYVMKLLTDLSPVSELIYSNDQGDFKDYLTTFGNLRKKLEVLIELSRVLARLHSKGMIYGDISPRNVFYSKKDVFSKVWLIDCDNLHLYDEVVSTIYTPNFGAPEVVMKQSLNTIYSDSFSFAVLAFKVLSAQHPFINEFIKNDSSGGWDDSELDSKSTVDANDSVWLCDKDAKTPKDVLDIVNHLVPVNLMKLFEQTFDSKGRRLPYTRPSMRTWYENLYEAYTKMWKCSCGNYNFFTNKNCFICGNPMNKEAYGSLYTVVEKNVHEVAINKFIASKPGDDPNEFFVDNLIYIDKSMIIFDGLSLYNFDFENISIYDTPKPYITFNYFNDALIVTNRADVDCEYIISKDNHGRFRDEKKLNKGQNMTLTFYKNKVRYKILYIVA